MSPSTIIAELRGGHSAAARTGLFWLLLGAGVTLFVIVMLSPSVGGLRGLPDLGLHRADAPVKRAVPRLTQRQRNLARKASVRAAFAEVGAREWRTNNSPKIIRYRTAVRGPGERVGQAEPWCADFVSWVWRRAGVPLGFGGLGADYVPQLVGWASFTGRWHAARKGYRPRPGDLVVYQTSRSRMGHVGLVAKVRRGRMLTVEGNFKDRVVRRVVKVTRSDVTGFIAPV